MKFNRLVPSWFALMIAVSVTIVIAGVCNLKHATNCQRTKGEVTVNGVAASQTVSGQVNLLDQLWIDRLPTSPNSPFNCYIFASRDSEATTAHFAFASSYKFTIELFDFKADLKANKIAFIFPHDKRKAESNYTIESVDTPEHFFDSMLTLQKDPQNGGKATAYYSCPELSVDGNMNAEQVRTLVNKVCFGK